MDPFFLSGLQGTRDMFVPNKPFAQSNRLKLTIEHLSESKIWHNLPKNRYYQQSTSHFLHILQLDVSERAEL